LRYPTGCPFGVPGDRLWIAETWWKSPVGTARMRREGADTLPDIVYDTDCSDAGRDQLREWHWMRKPASNLRREDSRITLEITSVRVERVQEISSNDAIAEGIYPAIELQNDVSKWWDYQYKCWSNFARSPSAVDSFRTLWDSFNAKRGYGWKLNPWVWVVEFKWCSTMTIRYSAWLSSMRRKR